MKAAVLHEVGRAPRFEEFAEPSPGENEVLVQVRAAALKAVDRAMADGSHYASFREFPVVCGIDGVGMLENGARVFFGGPRRPFGAMAERTVAPQGFCFPVPDGVDDATAAALPNAGLSSWLPLTWRAKLVPGERVLVLGATGVAGKLAVQIAKLMGAGRVVAAGRNEQVLNTLGSLGADAMISLDLTDSELAEAFARDGRLDIILDYVWGRPTEVLLRALTRKEFAASGSEVRLVQIGESAAPEIALPAAALRSSAVTIMGSGGVPPFGVIKSAYAQLMEHAAQGELQIDLERVPLAEIEAAWQRGTMPGRRIVVIP